LAFVGDVRGAARQVGIVNVGIWGRHKIFLALLRASAPVDGKRENGQIKRDQNKGYQEPHEYENNGLDEGDQSSQAKANFFLVKFGNVVQHGGESSAGFADFNHVESELGHDVPRGQGAVEGFAFADHFGGVANRAAEQSAGDGILRGLQSGD